MSISSTKSPSVAEAATNWFPASRERNAESEPSVPGPSMRAQDFPASRETNRAPLEEETTMALATIALPPAPN